MPEKTEEVQELLAIAKLHIGNMCKVKTGELHPAYLERMLKEATRATSLLQQIKSILAIGLDELRPK
jgi:hypothetical protein